MLAARRARSGASHKGTHLSSCANQLSYKPNPGTANCESKGRVNAALIVLNPAVSQDWDSSRKLRNWSEREG